MRQCVCMCQVCWSVLAFSHVCESCLCLCVHYTTGLVHTYGRTKQLKDACIKIKIKVNQHTKGCIRMDVTLPYTCDRQEVKLDQATTALYMHLPYSDTCDITRGASANGSDLDLYMWHIRIIINTTYKGFNLLRTEHG